MVRAAFEAAAEMIDGVKMALNAQAYCCDLLISLEDKAVREAARNIRHTHTDWSGTSHLPPYLDCHTTNPSPANIDQRSTSILKTKRRQKYLQERKIIHLAAAVQRLQDFTEPKAGVRR